MGKSVECFDSIPYILIWFRSDGNTFFQVPTIVQCSGKFPTLLFPSFIGGFTGFAEVDHFQHLQRVIDTSINIVPVVEALDIHGSAYVFIDEFTDQGLTGSDVRQTTENSNTENSVVPSPRPIEPRLTSNLSTENPEPVASLLNPPQARIIIEDYVGWTKPSKGLKAPADPETLRRSKRIIKEDLK